MTANQNGASKTMNLTPVEALEMAVKAFNEGKLNVAESIANSIVKSIPSNADALHLLGVLASQKGDLDAAIGHVTKAVRLNPRNPQYHSNLAEMQRRAGNLDDALKTAMQALELNARSSSALSNLGIIHYDRGEFDEAKAWQEKALKYDRTNIQALNNLGSISKENKDLDEAISFYRKVLEIDPDYTESRNNLGAILVDNDQAEEAIEVLVHLIRKTPAHAEAHRNMGRAFMRLEDWAKAETGFKNALKADPQNTKAMVGLSNALQELQQPEEALSIVEKAVAQDPSDASAQLQMGRLLADSGEHAAAGMSYNKALEIEPEFGSALLARGHWYMEDGEFALARSDFESILDATDGDSVSAHSALVSLDKVAEGNESFAFLKSKENEVEERPESKRFGFYFALAKCYDDLGDYDTAFGYYKKGCDAKRGTVQYNPDREIKDLEQTKRVFTPANIKVMREGAIDAKEPIFVVGMPRSGTTLTETILGSHSTVFAAGELPDLQRVFSTTGKRNDSGFIQNAEKMSAAALRECAEDYVAGIRARAPDAARITDKMPANYRMVGLIHALMPNAKIIHVNRDPMDTCLSNYTRLFSKSLYQTYDLVELGNYYNSYRDTMAHWRSVLPKDAFYDIQYEDLVSDVEPQVRALLEFCELPWEEACLDFHNTKRNVRTASVTQVRKPMYTSSVAKWKRYEKHLAPLKAVIDR